MEKENVDDELLHKGDSCSYCNICEQ